MTAVFDVLRRMAFAGLVCATLFAAPAHAADIDYLAGDWAEGGTSTLVWASYPRSGQSFTIPVGETRIYAASLVVGYFETLSPGGTLSLHQLTGSTPGPALASIPLPPAEESPSIVTLAIPGGLEVTPGATYVLLLNFQSGQPMRVAYRDDVYLDGDLYQENNGPRRPADDAFFKISFDPASAPASPVPTMSEWAMMLLGLLLAGATAVHLQRRGALS